MARFSNAPSVAPKAKNAPWSIGPKPLRARTAEYGLGFAPSDAQAELFNAAVSGLLADQFYESGDVRIARLVDLVPRCDPEWLTGFIGWLRSGANIRSASVVIAAEYAAAKFPQARSVVASALQRADEPGEMLAYWVSQHGRNIPQPIKRGVADACQRLYTETSLLRYDGNAKAWRFGDVIEVVHPKPIAPWQSALFKFALDRRRHDAVVHPGVLPKVSRTLMFETLPVGQRTVAKYREADGIEFSWERLAGWVNGPMDREAWEAVIPSMGYMALLRNLNNFDRNGVDPAIVLSRLTNAEAIHGSRVLPFRFQTAYNNLETDNYKVALASAADVALANLPSLSGKTLIMVDCSGSMSHPVGAGKSRNPLRASQCAGFMAEALARRCTESLIVCYDQTIVSSTTPKRHQSVLLAANDERYTPRGGTATWRCTGQAYAAIPGGADRVIIITDEQTSDADTGMVTVPVITWNIAGYKTHQAAHGSQNRMYVAGYSDSVLQTLPSVIVRGATGRWPWEA